MTGTAVTSTAVTSTAVTPDPTPEGAALAPAPAASPAAHRAGDTALYADLVRTALRGPGTRGWTLAPSPLWWFAAPPAAVLREQGWKLHVSATPLSAPAVLSRVAAVLAGERVPFKFARTPRLLTDLVAIDQERGSGGKFVTVYPADDEQFRRLAEALHRATAGLPGPGILSDRPYRPGSLVHYRYGVFRGTDRLTVDGTVEPMLRTPAGGLVRDRRPAHFAPPAWAVPPLPDPAPGPSPAPGRPAAVLLGDRYEVRSALRHSYRGGVYLATDRATGRDVVVKEARSHVGATLSGTDATDLLRHEAAVYARLAGLGIAPEVHGLLTQGGNHYLVQERVPGRTLRRWTADHLDAGRTPPTGPVRELARIVAQVHGLGLVLRDLSPDNIMVTPDDEVRLIDPEAVAEPGSPVRRVRTPGYSAPETADGGRAPGPEADCFSLGAVFLHVLTGADPVLAPDRPVRRRHDERLALLVGSVLADGPGARAHRRTVLAMMAEDPAARPGPDRLRAHLARPRPDAAPASASVPAPAPADGTAGDRMLDDGLTWLLDTMTPHDPQRLWPAGPSGERTDPLNVQHGAAGVLGALTAAGRHRPDPRLHAGIAGAARWIAARTEGPGPHLPGLYFGRSGTAWALLDAARLLDDDALAGHAVRLARAVPVRWPNPDVLHGAAGAGLTQLHFWRTTGDPGFLARAVTAAEHLLAAAAPGRAGTVWPVPRGFDSDLAGIAHYGFGHGVAGVGTFLLLAGLAAGRDDFVAAAQQAGETLLTAARPQDGAAGWAADDRRAGAPTHAPHWCSGASGIGTFLVRLWQATDDTRHREAAEAAAVAVHRGRHRSSPAACHGLAGDAQFLLDLADALDDPHHRRRAHGLVAAVHARHVLHEDLVLAPDETLTGVSAAYNTGLAGLLGLMVRLRHGGARPWLPHEGAPDSAEGRCST
ncbi:serine/threonine protein kinase [Kitasatospora sp. NE20-6]|uniref:class IV lanthionine synthetase LanL n=1 Tax=Kitasatospora sp. NE20-6 TaxID=2859066 RepID=UPI0034DBE0C3